MTERVWTVAILCAGFATSLALPASAQEWRGASAGVVLGRGWTATSDAESVAFDTTLDGTFGEIVRTAAGVDAFSPGFCGGTATSAVASDGCLDDKGGLDVGGRVGYDWQWNRLVVGAVGELSRLDVTDATTAFSTTPAFYTFTRKPTQTIGLRARAGVAIDRWLLYGTVGPAWSRLKQAFATSNAANLFVPRLNEDRDDEGFVSRAVWGVQAGVGAEVRVGAHWSVGGEYLYARFDDRDDAIVRATRGAAPATNPFILANPEGTDLRRTDPLTVGTLRGGLSYRF